MIKKQGTTLKGTKQIHAWKTEVYIEIQKRKRNRVFDQVWETLKGNPKESPSNFNSQIRVQVIMPQQHTTADQVNFLTQWFTSWSEMQREDFMPILIQAYQPKDHINGLLGGMDALTVHGRRPSLFDCQVKLFHDWYGNWAESEKSRLLEQLRAADPDFMAQYDKQISSSSSGAQEESPAPVETMEEGHNPPSSVSSPPSTLPRSHSPHDSGLDEPPSDSDHTEPHSLDSSHEPEDQRTANSQVALESVTAPTPPMKSCISSAENTACQKPEALANGCSDVINSAPSEQVLTTAAIEEGQVEQ